MRLIYRGCAVTTYGNKCLSISDRDGKQVYQTSDRTVNTEDEVRQFLKDYVKEHRL